MSNSVNTVRLVRNLRKGKHEKFAIQKTLARIRRVARSPKNRIQFQNDLVGGKKSYREINGNEAHLQDLGLRNQGKE